VKRLLLVCYYYPPAAGGGVARPLSFARYLPALGWQVTVLCADHGSAPLADTSRALALPQGVEVIRVPMPESAARGRRAVIGSQPGRPSGLYRAARGVSSWIWVPDSFYPWAPIATMYAKERLERGGVNAILTTSPPDTVHLVGLGLTTRLPWVVDFRDPWIGLTYKRPPTPIHAWRQRKLRDAVLRRADLVLATTQASAAHLSKVAPSGKRITVLPNGWDPDFTERADAGRAGGHSRRLRLVYTGTLWDVPAARSFFAGLARALGSAQMRAVEVDIVGPYETEEKNLVHKLGLGDVVRFVGQVGYEESRRRQLEADVLLVLQIHGPGYDLAIPGKLYEYIASQRPILAFLPRGEGADLVTRAGGWVVAPDDAPGTEQALARLLRGERPGGESSARQMLTYEHRRDRIAERLAHLLNEVAR
jgi:glycosyltransferase involved in cell wall biosynthesis